MTTATRTKENGCDFPLFKTPLRTPLRHGMLSSATLNDLSSYSNKPLKYVHTTSMNDLQKSSECVTTPIRFNKTKYSTPISVQRRRALGLVSHNSNQIPNENLSEDDLPHTQHSYPDTFDDLIPANERIERMIRNRIGGVNIFSYYGGNDNKIRCQSPACSRIDVSTLLDILN